MKLLILATLLPSLALAGGVTGGGGNTKPAQPVTNAEVKESILGARLFVAAYLNHLEHFSDDPGHWQGQPALAGKLFGAHPTLDQVLHLPIHIEENGPCLDPNGNPMDGSATLSPPQVCLSVASIQPKLSREALRSQVIALALHEYSHLSGTTEPEAEFLQSMALDNFLTADFAGIQRLVGRAWSSVVYLQEFAGGGGAVPPESPEVWLQLGQTLNSFEQDLERNLFGAPSVDYFALTSAALRESFNLTFARIDLMANGACERARGFDFGKCRQHLDLVFGQAAEIDYHTYMVRLGAKPGSFQEHPGIVFQRVRTMPDVQKELLRLKVDADAYIDYLKGMRGY